MICPHCGYSLDDGVAFCIYCGKRLGKYATTAPDASATEPAAAEQVGAQAAPAAAAGAAAAATTAALDLGDVAQASAAEGPTAEGPTVEGSAAETAGDPLPESAWDLTGDYPDAPASDAPDASAPDVTADLANEAVASDAGVAPIAPPPAADQQATRLHGDDAFSKRMNQSPTRRTQGSRKGLAAGILGVLLVAGIGVGALVVAPNMSSNPSTPIAPTSSSTASDSSSSQDSSSSSADTSSSSSSSEGTEDKPETLRGSTLQNATSGGGTAEGGAAADNGGGNATSGSADNGGGTGDAGGNAAYYAPAPAPAPAAESAPADNGGSQPASYPVFAASGATATSTSPTEGSTPHTPDLVLDGIAETAWNSNESGIGQSITLTTGQTSVVNGIRIKGGYNKISYSGSDLYWDNSRPRDILVEYEGGSFTYTMGDYRDTYQEMYINPPAYTTWIKVTIQSVYQGGKYDDCCISDIQVF